MLMFFYFAFAKKKFAFAYFYFAKANHRVWPFIKTGVKSHCTHCTDAVTCWFSKFTSVMWVKKPCHWCHLMSLKVQWVTWKNKPHYTGIYWYSASCDIRAMSAMCFWKWMNPSNVFRGKTVIPQTNHPSRLPIVPNRYTYSVSLHM